MTILEHLLRASPPREPVASLDAWYERLSSSPYEAPIDRALWAGFEADRLGYAFVGGYSAALQRLLGKSAPLRLSLCATETGGAHPKAINTKLEKVGGEMFVRGEKTFATLASKAEELLVVASRGVGSDGKNRLRLVRVKPNANGVTIKDRESTKFAPEIPHSVVTLVNVVVRDEDVLPGDAYTEYLKPFRTIEDAHVLAATLGYVIREARASSFNPALVEGVVPLVIALREIVQRAPLDPIGHIALSGLFVGARRLIAEHHDEWEKAPAATRDWWRRDMALLMIAENARTKRTEAAWQALSSSS